nr:phosphatidylinositol 4-kinase beta-like [Labrus bergylta]
MADAEVSLSPALIPLDLSPSHSALPPPPTSSSSPTTFSCPSSPSSASSSSSSSSSSSCSESSSDCPAHHHHHHHHHHHPRPQLQLPPPPQSELPSSPSASPRSSSPSGSIGSTGSLGSSSSASEGIGSGISSGGDPRGPSPPLDVISEDAMEMDLGADQVIDPEVALKACQEVLLKVKLQNREAPEEQQSNDKQPGDQPQQQNCECSSPQWLLSPDTSSIKEEEEEEEETGKDAEKQSLTRSESTLLPTAASSSSSKQSWLLRLFESKLFDVSMAISYLYKSKEPGVQAYIGNRLFSFPDNEVDFYLPQLLNMYVHMDTEVGDAIRPYLIHRCTGSITFSLLTAWLLGAYSNDMHISTQRHSRGTKLRKLILSDDLKPSPEAPPSVSDSPVSSPSHRRCHRRHNSSNVDPSPSFSTTGAVPESPEPGGVFVSPSRRTHQRSKSDATTASSGPGSGLRRTGSNPKVECVHEEVNTFSSCIRKVSHQA